MRSRDGNSSISPSIPVTLLFLFYSLALHAGEYLISYRYLVKDAMLYSESLEISHAMKKCQGEEKEAIYLPADEHKNLKNIISLHNEEFLRYLHKLGLSVSHKEETINAQYSSVTILTLKTTCFKVDFNDNFVKISALK